MKSKTKASNVKMKGKKAMKTGVGRLKGVKLAGEKKPRGKGNGPDGRKGPGKGEDQSLVTSAATSGELNPLAGKVWALEVKRERCFPSPTNPRKDFKEEALVELGNSIVSVGQLSALVVRPRGSKKEELRFKNAEEVEAFLADPMSEFEIVAGERRWRATGKKYGNLETVRVEVRCLLDREVVEAQWVENLQREGLSPLEEGEGYARLKSEGWSVKQMAETFQKSESSIFERLKLARLEGPARALLVEGKISASVAALIGMVPDKQTQKALVTTDKKEHWNGCAVFDSDGQARPVREVAQYIEREAMRAIPWKLEEVYEHAEQVSPACRDCPKQTRNMGEENPDLVKGPARCMGLSCFAKRQEAVTARRRQEAADQGLEFWTVEQYNQRYYKDEFLVEGRSEWNNGKIVKVEKLFGKQPHGIVADSRGGMLRVWRREVLEAAGALKVEKGESAAEKQADREKDRRELKVFEKTKERVLEQLLAGLRGEFVSTPAAEYQAAILRSYYVDQLVGFGSREGVKVETVTMQQVLEELAKRLCGKRWYGLGKEEGQGQPTVVALLDMDVKGLRTAAEIELDAKEAKTRDKKIKQEATEKTEGED